MRMHTSNELQCTITARMTYHGRFNKGSSAKAETQSRGSIPAGGEGTPSTDASAIRVLLPHLCCHHVQQL